MKCRQARNWLMKAENPGDLPHAPPEVVGHVRACAKCRRVLREVRQLEEVWRTLPLPTSAETTRAAFLERYAPRTLTLPRRRWLGILARGAVAAALVLSVGLATLLFFQPRAQSAENLLDHLVDWNLALSQTSDKDERIKLFQDRANEFAVLVKKGTLPEEQKELAQKLMQNANWLADNGDDPLEEANRFSELADDMIDKLAATGDEKMVSQMAESYSRLAQKGINANLNQVGKVEKLAAKQKAELKKMLAKEEFRLEKLQKALKASTPQAQKQLKQAVSVTGNHPHKKKKLQVQGK